MTAILPSLAFVAGYVASIYSWPWLRTKFIGVEGEVASLEARATTLKVALTPASAPAPVAPKATP